ncbi:PfaB family protein [Psychromonas sp. KJ10-10]|uniref:PfaB family protein n=1 Tax=Psychromonas sp. KJ10-10 TaxID=3391823 RepID=UPI0039B55738
MALRLINDPFKVIGFNAVFNSLANEQALCDIDQVEACLYRGETLKQADTVFNALASCKSCIRFVLDANNLNIEQVALIVISKDDDLKHSLIAMQDKGRIVFVEHLSDALILSQQVMSDDTPVLIVSIANTDSSEKTQTTKATISFDSGFDGYASYQGVACILLANASFVNAHNSVVYASIDKMSTGEHQHIDQVIKACLEDLTPAQITTLEVSANAEQQLNLLEQHALLKAYTAQEPLTTSLSCHKSVLGENGCLSELMGLIQSIISLQQRYRPAIKNWFSPSQNLLKQWQDSTFYVFNQASPTFPDVSGKARINALSVLTEDDVSHLLISEVNDDFIHENGFNRCGKQSLFIIGANNEQDLLKKIDLLVEKLRQKPELKTLAEALFKQYQQSDFIYKVVLIAESIEELNKELLLSLQGIKKSFININNDQCDWKTPKGSYFTSQPQKNAKTAFLYPGIGATYIGLGRDLFHLFPEIYPSVIALADDISTSLKDELLNPRSIVSLDFKTLQQRELELRYSLANIAECGVGYACVFTKIFEQVFNIKADFASGYSMGEISMFAALGCWQNPGAMSARLANSDTFNHQLSGELRSIRKLWNLPDIEDGQFEPIWETYSIKGTLEQVTASIYENERVYVTIINTPDSLVIAGYPEDCLKVIQRLGVRAMPLNMANAIHSEPAYQEYDHMLELYNMPVTERIQTKMFSSSCYLAIPQLQHAIAVSIAKCLCQPVDFPRLIKTLADKQNQVFIEMGAGRSLCSWTDKILTAYSLKNQSQKNHISVPVNAKGTDDQLTYARAMAKLVSFGVEVKLDSFFTGSIIRQVKQKS